MKAIVGEDLFVQIFPIELRVVESICSPSSFVGTTYDEREVRFKHAVLLPDWFLRRLYFQERYICPFHRVTGCVSLVGLVG
jgi:hypothetical protein